MLAVWCAQKPPDVYSAPLLLVQEGGEDGGEVAQVLRRRQPSLVVIDCVTLLAPSVLYGRVAEALFRLSRREAMQIETANAFLRLCQMSPLLTGSDCPQLTVLLLNCHALLGQDLGPLWMLLHLPQVSVCHDWAVPGTLLISDYGLAGSTDSAEARSALESFPHRVWQSICRVSGKCYRLWRKQQQQRSANHCRWQSDGW